MGRCRCAKIHPMSKFSQLQQKIEAEGKSPAVAAAITYSIGKKKYGKAGMAKKAAIGKAKAAKAAKGS